MRGLNSEIMGDGNGNEDQVKGSEPFGWRLTTFAVFSAAACGRSAPDLLGLALGRQERRGIG